MTLKLDEIEQLDRERTPGNWFFSARTLRSEVKDEEKDIVELPDILHVDSDKCVFGREYDLKLIESAPDIVKQYLRARKFEVTEEFVEKVEDKLLELDETNNQRFHRDMADPILICKAVLAAMWEEVENE